MTKKLWAGLDVGVETTTVCVINDAGEVIHESSCPTALDSVRRELFCLRRRRRAKVCLEAATGMHLARGLRNAGYSVELYEARQLSKFLRIRRNKTDAGDASGIAEAGRLGAATISKVHLKSLECQCLQSRLAIRRQLIRQRVATVNMLGRQLELYGGRLRCTKSGQLRAAAEAEIRKVFGKAPSALTRELRHLIDHYERFLEHQRSVDRELGRWAAENEVCRRLMEIPGVGPLCALTFYAAVGDPERFRRSADIGSYFGLAPKIHQSGLTLRRGRISKMGNRAVRTQLVQASTAFMRWSSPESEVRSWAARIEQRRGRAKSRVALARKLATVMLAMWKSGKDYEPRTAMERRNVSAGGEELDLGNRLIA